uniref:EGF-like domain-containing protein n=1 Tax=Branchiostoma floridae TaxID=7739 RepID=C3Y279_BRAFL|eukprot:XP_002609959.1 hypothetical protein BRAFLDRAFT_85915 [Branchiostoma floridae]
MNRQLHDDRPVYRSSGGNYLYFDRSDITWNVGRRVGSQVVGLYVVDFSTYADSISGTWYQAFSYGLGHIPNRYIRASCDNIDECADGSVCVNGRCTNAPGNYTCTCNTGYRMNPTTQNCEGLSIGAIVGISLGAAAAVLFTTAVLYCCCCKKSGSVATAEHTRPANDSNPRAAPVPATPPPMYYPPSQAEPDGSLFVHIDECLDDALNNCDLDNGGSCVNTQGSFHCACDDGYNLQADRRTCQDIDECVDNSTCVNGVCTNSVGSYNCTCNTGYMKNPTATQTCEDIDECADSSTCVNGRCTNVPGNYTCTCNTGYRMNPTTQSCEGLSMGIGAIVGISLGAAAAVLFTAAGLYCCCCKKSGGCSDCGTYPACQR